MSPAETSLALIRHEDTALPNPFSATTPEEIQYALDLLTRHSPSKQPWVAFVARSNGDEISIGLGTPLFVTETGQALAPPPSPDLTVLNFMSASCDPPYFVSTGALTDSGCLVFFTDGHWTEYPSSWAVDIATARKAISEFITGTSLPPSIQWSIV